MTTEQGPSGGRGLVAAIGSGPDLDLARLAGAVVHEAAGPDAVRAAWHALPPEVAVVLLTADAADALVALRERRGAPLTAVLP